MDLSKQEKDYNRKNEWDCYRRITFSFNREEIGEDRKNVDDLAALDSSNVEKTFTENVAALETGVSQDANAEGLQNFIVKNPQSTLVESGDMTPFEVLDKSQRDTSETLLEELKMGKKRKADIAVQLEGDELVSFTSDSEFAQSEDDGNTSSEIEPEVKNKRSRKVVKTRKIDRKE
ncbi:unnamed protein product [Brugia pahangi]|uniref:DUF4604 domain-containing protein n=1 Tax=Brugia pahangi TaxID=6280 RepID=A0A0N4TTB7_BRUPA|nr:unnamed protein product [Brugia pahangi]